MPEKELRSFLASVQDCAQNVHETNHPATVELEFWFNPGMVKASLGRAGDAVRVLDQTEPLGKRQSHPGRHRAWFTGLVEQGQAEFGISTQMAFGSAIAAEMVGNYGFTVVSAKGHPWLGKRRRVTWPELVGQKVIGLNPLSSTPLQVNAELASAGVELPWTLKVDQFSTMLGPVKDEGYLAVLPTLFDAKRYGLKVLALTEPIVQRKLFFVRRRDSFLSPEAKTMADMLCAAIRSKHP